MFIVVLPFILKEQYCVHVCVCVCVGTCHYRTTTILSLTHTYYVCIYSTHSTIELYRASCICINITLWPRRRFTYFASPLMFYCFYTEPYRRPFELIIVRTIGFNFSTTCRKPLATHQCMREWQRKRESRVNIIITDWSVLTPWIVQKQRTALCFLLAVLASCKKFSTNHFIPYIFSPFKYFLPWIPQF